MKTPYFIIDESELEKNIVKLENALDRYWSNCIIGYSFKTNALPYLLAYMRNRGIYAEVVSEDEFRLAHKLGFKTNKIIYNGPVKGRESFLKALEDGAIVNIDSNQEIVWLQELKPDKDYSIGIRVNFDLEKYCPGETSGGNEGSRFGFCYENGELKAVIERLQRMEHIKIAGIHLHNSTKTRSVNVYKKIARMACTIAEEFYLDLKYVDVGGGFFCGLENKPQFGEYIYAISEELKKGFSIKATSLVVEPGTSVISSPVDFVTSVLDVKRTTKNNFIITDGSRINIDPLMRKKGYFSETEYRNQEDRKIIPRQVISGFTCMENDRLFVLENEKELQAGDRIRYKKVGGYTMCLNPLFIQYFPAVYWKNKDSIICVRESWTEENYLQNSVWEDN